MRYLIFTDSHEPFYTNWFQYENHFNEKENMVVFDLVYHKYTIDGKTWNDIKEDHL